MNLMAIIFSGLFLLQVITMNMLFTDYSKDLQEKFEEKRLQIAVNYAVEAATQEMIIKSANLEQDYLTLNYVNVDPMVASDTFSTIILENYNIPVNDVNRQSIMLEYCPVFMVAGFDGYYNMERQKINSSGVENMIFSTKIPYSDTVVNDEGEREYYSYNLSYDYAIKFNKDGKIYKVTEDLPKSEREMKNVVSTVISDTLNDNLVRYAHDDPRGEIYVPAEMTSLMTTNPIENTTVLAYIDNFDLAGLGYNLQSFGIGGSDIRQKPVVVGFAKEVNGETHYFYTYSDKLPEDAQLIEAFDSQQDAASKGYYFYLNE